MLGQQILNAIAENGVRVAAAEFHQVIFALGVHRPGNEPGQRARRTRRHESRGRNASAGIPRLRGDLIEQRQRFLGFGNVKSGDGKAGVDDDVIADHGLVDQRQ